ncbi:UbiD family decarboxylase [Robbsia sp. Bb-Pol-6]|uniref:UbiD family decarboxylase n=1 Tax=Robbsia betulipollinis TaxID=2981849 RepID=A0ABT3ZJF5_9BURK|nr:UbiD family decarboxylase [Robbsia betulipollinis]MCY0386654.1 UbiD family decarboxylase [Robbsia betulipollinis]
MNSPEDSNFPVCDLRSALEFLKQIPGEYIETSEPVDPHAELSGVYRYVGAHGTVMRPTQLGPAMVFNKVKGYDDVRVAIGVLASRKRVAALMNTTQEKVAFMFKDAVATPIAPVVVSAEKALCQEVVHRAIDPDFDILKILPAPTNTEHDAGPYFTMGLVYAEDPENGQHDVTIHRLCVQGKDEISIFLQPGGRHIDVFRKKAEAAGKALQVSISMGVDPAIYIGTCYEAPTTPLGYDELGVAGSIRQKAVELVQCLTINGRGIANAEIVIEGEVLPEMRVEEDQHTHTGYAMPEFPGYNGVANPSLPIIKVKAITHRRSPILQTCIGPSEEHCSMEGITTESSILTMVERAMPGFVKNVHNPAPGNGKYLSIIQVKKLQPVDEGRQRQAALLAFAAFSELKHIILVDEDVDIFDLSDVMWAMTTRYQGDVSTIFIPGVRCHPLDPSSDPAFSHSIRDHGIACKTIFDCTVPFALKGKFQRSEFMEVDVSRFIPGFPKHQ